jgi:predicted DNA-binding transcriptional regulator AlpA
MPATPEARFVTFPQLAERYGVPFSRVHIFRLARAGRFPAPVKIAPPPSRSIAWLESEILEYVAQRKAARPGVVAFDDLKRAQDKAAA